MDLRNLNLISATLFHILMSYICHLDYNSLIWSKLFGSAFYFLAHLGAKSTWSSKPHVHSIEFYHIFQVRNHLNNLYQQ